MDLARNHWYLTLSPHNVPRSKSLEDGCSDQVGGPRKNAACTTVCRASPDFARRGCVLGGGDATSGVGGGRRKGQRGLFKPVQTCLNNGVDRAIRQAGSRKWLELLGKRCRRKDLARKGELHLYLSLLGEWSECGGAARRGMLVDLASNKWSR